MLWGGGWELWSKERSGKLSGWVVSKAVSAWTGLTLDFAWPGRVIEGDWWMTLVDGVGLWEVTLVAMDKDCSWGMDVEDGVGWTVSVSVGDSWFIRATVDGMVLD